MALNSGRHTTTRTLVLAGTGRRHGNLRSDLPGFQEFGPHRVAGGRPAPARTTSAPLLGQCRFCSRTHQREPGCAIRTAVDDGRRVPPAATASRLSSCSPGRKRLAGRSPPDAVPFPRSRPLRRGHRPKRTCQASTITPPHRLGLNRRLHLALAAGASLWRPPRRPSPITEAAGLYPFHPAVHPVLHSIPGAPPLRSVPSRPFLPFHFQAP